MFVTKDGQDQHETPLCPEVKGEMHYALCHEEALYTYGEKWCETCGMHRLTVDDSRWTYPRFRKDGDGE